MNGPLEVRKMHNEEAAEASVVAASALRWERDMGVTRH